MDINSDIASSPADWPWVNLDSNRVYDCLVAYPGDGYFATADGAFRLPRTFLQDLTPSIDEHKQPLTTPGKVFSLGLIDQSGDGDTLFMGTDNGVWYAQIDAGEFLESPKLEAGTAGQAIRMIAISDFWPTFKAYLGNSYLFIWDDTDLTSYPLCAGLPGKVTGMAWYRTGTTTVFTYLIVAGEYGLVYLLVAFG